MGHALVGDPNFASEAVGESLHVFYCGIKFITVRKERILALVQFVVYEYFAATRLLSDVI